MDGVFFLIFGDQYFRRESPLLGNFMIVERFGYCMLLASELSGIL